MPARFVSLLIQWNRIWSNNLNQPAVRRRPGRMNAVPSLVEQLEQRSMLSTASILSSLHANTTYEVVNHATHATSVSYSPSQILSAYGFNSVNYTGTGQTIAIIDAYHNPTIQTDLQTFDTMFGLPNPPSFQVMSQTGSTTALPGTDPTKGWEVEEALDVEWAHALAPGASIVLVEANSASDADLFAAVRTAANLPGVSVVSMSFGGGEFSSEASYDSVFTTPAGHQGVTFLASTGDNGAPGGFPAYSSNVVAVGGTTLTVNSSGSYVSESGWSGSGGGISPYESQPSYQHGVVTQTTTKRSIPDVSFDADPNSGVMVCCSFTYGSSNPWITVGGTSFSAPAWGGIMAIIDQARVQNGLSTLDGATQTLPMLYQLSQTTPSAFHDVTTGNNGYAAATGYDLVTGLGSPVVNVLVGAMSGTTSTSSPSLKLAIQHAPTSAVAGATLGAFTVAVEYQNGQVVTSDTSTVTLTLSSGTFSTGSSTATATAVNGVANFGSLKINAAGTYQITVSDSASLAPITSGNLVISVGALSRLAFQQNPTTGIAGTALAPAVTVAAVDQYGNVVTTPTTIMLTLTGGTFANRTTTVSAATSGGIATFSNLLINTAGNYTLTASTTSLSSGASFNVAVSPAAATKLVLQTAPSTTAVAGTTIGSIVVAVQDAYGNIVTSDNSTVTLTLSTGTFSTGSATATATAVHGIATFSGVAISKIGSYRITISNSASITTVTTGNIAITPSSLGSLTVQQNPTVGTAGVAMSLATRVATLDQFGNIATASSTVTLTLAGATFAGGGTTVTMATYNGVATFTGLIINTAGTYSLTARVGSVTATPFSVTINPAAAKQPVWQSAPGSTAVAGVILNPLTVIAQDAFGNQVSGAATVTLTLSGGKFANGSTMVTAAASGGVATFSTLAINAAGSYTLTASIGVNTTSASSITVSPAAASKIVWRTAPVATAVAGTTLSSVVALVEDAFGNVVTTDHSTITLTLSTGAFSTGSATATATAASGVATFSSLIIKTVGIYKITASDGSLSTVVSGNVAITPAALSSLAIQQNPTIGTAGTSLAPTVKVTALDQYGNTVTAANSVTLTLTSGTFSNGSTTATANTIGGVATFNSLIITVSGNYTLTASIGSVASPSFNVAVTPNTARQPVWQTAPGSTAVAGTALSTIRVDAEDIYGNLVSADATVTLRLTGGKFSDGTTMSTATSANGIATFSGLTINTAGNYTLTAYVGSMATAASSVTVRPAAASKLVWQAAPGTTTVAGTTLKTVVVAVEDTYGNIVTSDSSTVTLTLNNGTFSTSAATATATAASGIATFSNLVINTTGTYQLTASDSASLTTVTTGNVVITPASLSSLSFQQNPTTGTAGVVLSPAVKVAALDQFGNLLTASTMVTLTISGGTFSNKSTTVVAVTGGGVATFSTLLINTVGNYTLTASTSSVTGPSFNLAVSPNTPTKLVLQTAPTTTAVAGTNIGSVVASVQDAFGNVVTTDNSTVTLTLSTAAFSSGSSTASATAVNGIATFSGLAINKTGSYRITVSNSASIITATTGNIAITPDSLSSLTVQSNPTTGTAGVALSLATKVATLDQFGNIATASSTVTLTLAGATFAGGGTTVTASTTNGVATFTGLIVNAAGTYSLTPSVGSVTGTAFNVTINPAAAKQPVWQSAPGSTAVAGVALNPVTVIADDVFGNQVTSAATVTLTIAGGKFANGSTMVTAPASGGIATFSTLAINTAGTYTLTASIGSMTTSSTSITVSPAAPSKVVWQTGPMTTTIAGTTLNSVVALVEDAFGNIVTTDTSTVTLTLSSGTFSTGSATVTATAASGVATFSSLAINTVGTYKITASDSSLNTVTSGNVLITPASLSSLSIQQNPTTGTAGMSLTPTVKVTALDQFGNFVTVANSVTLTLTSGTFANGSTSLTVNTFGGIATFSGLIMNVAGNYTLTASVGSVTSASFDVAISPNTAKQPVWQTAPGSTALTGVALNSIVVAVNDAYGNQVSASPTVTLRLTGGKFSDGTTYATVTAENGLATFSGLTFSTAGTYTLTAYVGSMATTASTVIVTVPS